MNERIIIAGFGGQGVLSMGKMLAEAAVEEGREVSWLPSYGPEMRGGTSSVGVIISDKAVGAPTISVGTATCVIAMNRPSLEKFESYLAPGGLLLINSSSVDVKATRTDVDVRYVQANELASELGNEKVSNMIVLGAYIAQTGTLDPETLLGCLAAAFGEKKAHLVGLNREAISKGAAFAKAAAGGGAAK
jgi:2-oxoglutarate ferredoxin oxidoreductase subunit gamma